MNPEKLGKTLGIGVRVAGRIAQQRVQSQNGNPAQPANQSPLQQTGQRAASPSSQSPDAQAQPGMTALPNLSNLPTNLPSYATAAKEFAPKAHKLTRAAGRGMGGFLRPFGRVGGILWLEVTGFFFGLFALYFAQDIWKTRLSYAAGPMHTRFLIAVGLTAVFGYLSASAFWRAGRR